MSVLMPNIRILRNDFKANGWHLTVFPFIYKSLEYAVILEDIDNLGLSRGKDDVWSVLLTFVDLADPDRRLTTKANSARFEASAVELRRFFGVSYMENLGDFLPQFHGRFGQCVPSVFVPFPRRYDIFAVSRLSRRDSENPDRVFCYGVRRNPPGKYRSIFNDNKTRILRPVIYGYLAADKTLSFCYTDNQALEKADTDILKAFPVGVTSSP